MRKGLTVRFRDQCLNEHWFTSIAEAQMMIEQWRADLQHDQASQFTGWKDATRSLQLRVPASAGTRAITGGIFP